MSLMVGFDHQSNIIEKADKYKGKLFKRDKNFYKIETSIYLNFALLIIK